jgi:beta-ribofuranosylaminobenzene 5'-phosphate synthase
MNQPINNQNTEFIKTASSTHIALSATSVNVNTAARLHMGFFDLHGGLGRKFGSIGLALAAPSLELTAQFTGAAIPDEVPTESVENSVVTVKAANIARQLIAKLNLSGRVSIAIQQHLPTHAGLGSGTQLALAVGAAISRLYDLNLSSMQIAQLTGRGGRSGIGIAAFDHGGLLIDGGRGLIATAIAAPRPNLPPLLARYDFPEEWRVLLIIDSSQPGIHGDAERVAFDELPPFSENLAAHLCRHVLMQAMPAMVEHDLVSFGQSIRELQTHVGDYFAPAQGGRYASPLVASVLQYLEQAGVACLGQSSWGPTGFAVFASQATAEQHLQQLSTSFTNPLLSWMVCTARNHGAQIAAC